MEQTLLPQIKWKKVGGEKKEQEEEEEAAHCGCLPAIESQIVERKGENLIMTDAFDFYYK